MPQSLKTSLPPALQDLLEHQAPKATLLAHIGEQILSFQAGKAPKQISELAPPESWFDSGELEWLTHDGALLGLIWSPAGLHPSTLKLLTLLLSTTRGDEGQRATNVLMTQFPESAAWLDDQLRFLQVSRRFLDLYALSTDQVIGQPFERVFLGRSDLQERLEQGLAGKSVSVPQEAFSWKVAGKPQVLHLRSQIRPYYGGAGAGVLWTMQDISGEMALASRIAALLSGARVPTAILTLSGELLDCSDSLQEALIERQLQGPITGQPITEWSIWDNASTKAALSQALTQVSEGGSVRRSLRVSGASGDKSAPAESTRVEVHLHQGEAPLQLQPLVVAEFEFTESHDQHAQLLSSLVQQSPQAIILLGSPDESGERPLWLMSDVARQLLGFNKHSVKAGQPFDELLRQQQVSFARNDNTPTSLKSLRQQGLNPQKGGTQEALSLILTRSDGSRRHLEVTMIALNPLGTQAGPIGKYQQAPLSLYLEDVTSKRHLQDRLHHDARHDALTNLLNWPGLRELLSASKGARCLLVLSVDDFGALQAALGRSPSDHLLIQLAAKLYQWRKEASVARLEGENFVVALPPQTPEAATRLAQELQDLLSRPMRAGGREVQLSISVGMSCDTLSPDDLLDRGRTALHAAQRTGSGRGNVAFFDAELRAREAELVQLESELRRALPSQFTLLLQPIVSLINGRVQGAELLLRWNHPERGLIAPRIFLPLIERAGLMPTLGQWVLEQAVGFRKRWAQQYPFLQLQLNLSAQELSSSEYMQLFQQALGDVGGLNIEISAASLLGDSDDHDHSALLQELRIQGCEIFVDDFGDGASSITSLEKFALSGVKLHPAFVGHLQEGERPLALLEGTVSLARRLNLQVIAVGVETQAQAQLLSEAGCAAAQGYFYSPPKGLEDFEYWLTSQVMD